MTRALIYTSIVLLLVISSCNERSFVSVRETINLNGSWRFALDTNNAGIDEEWYMKSLDDSVVLPGTLDENNIGIPNKNRAETMRLSREKMYEGVAWYQKDVVIPENWEGQNISLTMERTKPTQVWVDNVSAGTSNDILTAQNYDLSPLLTPGKHTLTIMVNNGAGSVPRGITGSHAWTEHTQSNWNGIIGAFFLEAANRTFIEDVQVHPDIAAKKVIVNVNLKSISETPVDGEIIIQAYAWNTDKKKHLSPKSFPVKIINGATELELSYKMGNKILLWSEFDPALYKLSVTLKAKGILDNKVLDFGMRDFSTRGTQFTINGIKTFLRGKHDACIFPLTGHPPMDLEGWQRVFRIAKSYNINFFRFHSWTPPKAAFQAADIEGIYMQPELPFWGGFSKDLNQDLNAFLLREGENILQVYGNHASFVMFALGNELSGDQDVMNQFVAHFRALDDRHLMAFGSNNYLGFRGQAEGEDYYAACRVGADTDSTYSTHIRASFSFADTYDGGYINGRYPSTDLNYSGAISSCTVPAVSTEIGQYQVYPNYDEINKYTGVMKPWNFEIFRERLKENNLSNQALSFFRASGALSAICYKADIEMAFRTPGFGGFHLLDLQDFPGQGTALVGMLDAFMDSKGLITPEEFGHFCNRVVPLFIMEKYCWTNSEEFTGQIKVANYSESTMESQRVKWELVRFNGDVIDSDGLEADLIQGELSDVLTLKVDLSKIITAEKLSLNIYLEGTAYRNRYPLWVYPSDINTKVPDNVIVATKLDKKTLTELASGEKILLFPDFKEVQDLSVGGLFTPDYWNYRMFKMISEMNKRPVSPGTMSILTDPAHPLFSDFPTEFYSNWQWWPIVKNSRPFILDNTPPDYFPLVQVVDNIERNHKLGLIFEFAVGKGMVLVCMSDLMAVQDKPEGRQLYSSILKYISSESFNPVQQLTQNELIELFTKKVSAKKITGVSNISYQ